MSNVDSVNELLLNAKSIIDKYQASQDERLSAGLLYNVFSEIGVSGWELQHSAFIASLLDPKGMHGVSEKFLKAFLEVFPKQNEKNETSVKTMDIDYLNSYVQTEKDIGIIKEDTGGKIDIFIELSLQGVSQKKYAIVIENKLYAKDQKKQLQRYKNFAEANYKDNYSILYLTLDGHKPSKDSIVDSESNGIICVSYQNFICDWLDKCIKESAVLPLVRETIVQYRNLVNKLTFQEVNRMEENELIKLLLKDCNLEIAEQLQGQIQNAKEYFFEHFLVTWIKEVINDVEYVSTLDGERYRQYGPFCSLNNTNDEILKYVDIKIGFQRNNYERMYIQAEIRKDYLDDNNTKEIRERIKNNSDKKIIWNDIKDNAIGFFFEKDFETWNSKTIGTCLADGGKKFKEELSNQLKKIKSCIMN